MQKYKILLSCLNADFGQEGKLLPDESNCSWEKANIYPALKQLEKDGLIELETHWFDQQNNSDGYSRLLSLAKQVDFIFSVPVTHSLGIPLPQAKPILDYGTPIVTYHPDMHMRYKHQSGDKFVWSYFSEGYSSHFVSPAKHMIPELLNDGVKAYYMPFGIPNYSYKVDNIDKKYDVTIVAQKHGIREKVVNEIKSAGINVECWGHFWSKSNGRPNCIEMNEIFNQSKINLNLRWCSRDPNHGQVKGRDFELFGAGAFMLATQHNETNDTHDLYIPNVDFIEQHYLSDLIESIRFYLKNDNLRETIANSAYKKRDKNLWTTRFKNFLEDKLWTR